MKKLITLMALALVILVGCAKEETTPTVADNQQMDETSGWIIDMNSDSPVWELVTLDELPNNSATSATSRSNSSHTHGDFVYGPWTFSWSGTENDGGTHGSAYVERILSNGDVLQITMETECVMGEGNEAVYGGTMTEVLNGYGPYAVGNHMYFKVIDNGQGNNAPPDQHINRLLFTPANNSRCGILPPSNSFWTNGTARDVQEPGSVKVNN